MSYVTFQECCKTFRGLGEVGNGERHEGSWRLGGARGEEKNQAFPYITALAVCDKKLLHLRYKPDVWAKQSQLISQAFIDNENLEEGKRNCCL